MKMKNCPLQKKLYDTFFFGAPTLNEPKSFFNLNVQKEEEDIIKGDNLM
jgi:hypothetical protein